MTYLSRNNRAAVSFRYYAIHWETEPLPDYNPQFLSHNYNFLESLCIYYILTCDHKHKFPFTKVLTIAINLFYNVIYKTGIQLSPIGRQSLVCKKSVPRRR